MGLIQALNNSISGLNLNQQNLNVLSQNIANANTPNYSNEVVNQQAVFIDGEGAGVAVSSITRNINSFLTGEMQAQTSTNGAASTIQSYYTDIENLLGQPGGTTSMDQSITSFFTAMQSLADSPGSAAASTNAVNSGVAAASNISSLASQMYNLQMQSDSDISTAIKAVNSDLTNLSSINLAIEQASAAGQSTAGLLDQRDAAVTDISQYIDVKPTYQEDGQATLNTTSGTTLLSPQTYAQLSYQGASGVDQFVANQSLPPLVATTYSNDGKQLGNPTDLASSGTASTVTTTLQGGQIQGLLNVRDSVIPNIMNQLNEVASQLRDQVNAVSNKGVSYPPPNSYTAARAAVASSTSQYTGQFQVAVLNSTGGAIASPYADETNGMQPLTLNLGSLNYGNGAGVLSANNIVSAFNQYYGVQQNKLEVGNLNNVQLTMGSDAISGAAGTTMSFGFNLNNISGNSSSSTISITNIYAGDPSANVSAINGTIANTSTNTVASGGTDNTGNVFSGTFSSAASSATYFTVEANVTADGVQSTVYYRIPNNTSNVDNNVVGAESQTGSGTIVAPTSANPIATAELVDANGNPLTQTNGSYGNQQGYLKITADNSSQTIALNEMTSTQETTGQGVSQYFGFNNFFNTNSLTPTGDTLANSAYNLSVNSNLISNPGSVSVATLSQGIQPSSGAPNYTYVVNSGDASIAQDMANLSTTSVAFAAAGGLSTVSTTLPEYAGQIIANISTDSTNATNAATDSQTLLSGFTSRAQAVSGVNLDQELANTVIYQNAYAASARVITVIGTLFSTLINSIGGS